jgi:hypothetical protein
MSFEAAGITFEIGPKTAAVLGHVRFEVFTAVTMKNVV